MNTPQNPLPLPASDLFAIVDILRTANAALSPGAKMLGVTSNGKIVFGGLMPSGKILCAGGEAEECPWTCEAESALTVIGCLSAAAEQMKKILGVATDALRYYNSHDCLTTEQQQCAADALRNMANNHGWAAVCEDNLPPLDEIVWLWDGQRIWIGGRADDCDGWLWGNTYGSVWHNGAKWDGDLETDDDYKPTHWMRLPGPPNAEVSASGDENQKLK